MYEKETWAVTLGFDSETDPVLEIVRGVNSSDEALGKVLAKHRDKGMLVGWNIRSTRSISQLGLDDTTKAAIPFLKEGKKIGAIREVRACTGWGLEKAKEFVDKIDSKLYKKED